MELNLNHMPFERKYDQKNVWCHLIMGTSGRGRSYYLEGLDKNKVLERILTVEQEVKMFENKQERQAAEESRMQKVRDAYWDSTMSMKDGVDEFEWISYGLKELGVAEPSIEQIRQTYNFLDWVLVAEGIKWGFSDSVVRDNICEYFRDYSEEVKKNLGLE